MSVAHNKNEGCLKCLLVEIPVVVNLGQSLLGLIGCCSLHDGTLPFNGSFGTLLLPSSSGGLVSLSVLSEAVDLYAVVWVVGARWYG